MLIRRQQDGDNLQIEWCLLLRYRDHAQLRAFSRNPRQLLKHQLTRNTHADTERLTLVSGLQLQFRRVKRDPKMSL